MTWGQFVEAVESHLAVEANRRGLEAFRSRYMRNAVLDLQRYIPGYRSGNVTTYTAAQVNLLTHASLGELPAQAKPKAFYIICATGSPASPPTDVAVRTWDELAALETVSRSLNSLVFWVEAATGLLQVVQLRAGSDASDPANGIQRPSDWSDPDNLRVWYKVN
jgi:hypothetical protein